MDSREQPGKYILNECGIFGWRPWAISGITQFCYCTALGLEQVLFSAFQSVAFPNNFLVFFSSFFLSSPTVAISKQTSGP